MSNGNDVTIDLTNYKDRVGQRVQPGRYRVVVDDVEQDTARSGNTMINLWLRIVDGDFAGATVIDRLVLTENSMFRVVGFMQAIGMPTPKKRLRLNIQTFVGKQLEVDLDDGEPYNGRVKSEVRAYNRVSGVSADAADITDVLDAEEASEASAVDPLGISSDAGQDAPVQAEVDLDSLEL